MNNNIVVRDKNNKVIGLCTKMPASSLCNFQLSCQLIVSKAKYSFPFVLVLLNSKGEAFAAGCSSTESTLNAILEATSLDERYGGIVYIFLSSGGIITDGWHFSTEVIL